jgi:hypothetical protein
VEAAAAHEERLVIEIEVLTSHLELADAEPLAPRLDDNAVLDKLDNARVEIRMFRRPSAKVAEREADEDEERGV